MSIVDVLIKLIKECDDLELLYLIQSLLETAEN